MLDTIYIYNLCKSYWTWTIFSCIHENIVQVRYFQYKTADYHQNRRDSFFKNVKISYASVVELFYFFKHWKKQRNDHYKSKSLSNKPHLPGVLWCDVFVVKRCDHKSCILNFWDINALNACVMHLNASTWFIEVSISCVLNSNNCS